MHWSFRLSHSDGSYAEVYRVILYRNLAAEV